MQSCSVNSTDDWHIYGAHAAKYDGKQTNQTGLNNITSSFLSFSTCFHIICRCGKTTGCVLSWSKQLVFPASSHLFSLHSSNTYILLLRFIHYYLQPADWDLLHRSMCAQGQTRLPVIRITHNQGKSAITNLWCSNFGEYILLNNFLLYKTSLFSLFKGVGFCWTPL